MTDEALDAERLEEIARGFEGYPTPVDHRGKCWFCNGGLGHGPHGHAESCIWVHRDDLGEGVAALRARLEAAEQERDEWARVAVGADHDRAGEYGERLEAEERLAAAEAHTTRLAEALRDVGGQDATGDRICWCDGGPEHAPECDDARTALADYRQVAEHDTAVKPPR